MSQQNKSNKQTQYNISYFLQYIQTQEHNAIEDILNNEELRKAFTPLIVNRFLSFSRNKRQQFISALLNRYTFSFYWQPEINFGLMHLLTSKEFVEKRLPYVKMNYDKKKNKYDEAVYSAFKQYFGEYVKKDDIDFYIELMIEREPDKVISLMFKAGYNKSEIGKLIPELKPHLKRVKEPKLTIKQIRKLVKESIQNNIQEQSNNKSNQQQSPATNVSDLF